MPEERMYRVIHSTAVDVESHTSLQTTYNLDDTATAEQMAARAELCDRVAWARIAAANHRKWVMNEVRRWEQQARVKAFKAAGRKIREQDVLQDEINLTTAQCRIEAEIRTNAKLNGADPEAVMQQLRDEVAEHTQAA